MTNLHAAIVCEDFCLSMDFGARYHGPGRLNGHLDSHISLTLCLVDIPNLLTLFKKTRKSTLGSQVPLIFDIFLKQVSRLIS